MSATSNKSKILIFLMIVISLVFFIASFLAAAFNEKTSPASDIAGNNSLADCIVVRTAERTLAECSH